MPVAELRRFLPGRGGRFSAAAKTPGHGIPPDLPNKIIPVSFYPLKPKERAEPPPGFNRDAVELLIVESEEERRARDVARHVPCAGAVLQEYYTSLDIDFMPRVTVICGPKVSPKETARTDFGCLVFRPELIFLADTDIGGLLSEAKEKLESGRKITRLQLVQAFVGPRDLRNPGPGAASALPGLRLRPSPQQRAPGPRRRSGGDEAVFPELHLGNLEKSDKRHAHGRVRGRV
jgi:hypothetical protein